MPLGGGEERPERVPDAPPGTAEAPYDIGGDVRVGEALEPHRDRLPVERAVLLLEQPLHEGRLGTREDVRRDVAVVLDVAPQDRVEAAHLRHVLELVEDDERPGAGVPDPTGKIEERVQCRQRVNVPFDLELHADPQGAERKAEAGALEEVVDPRAKGALQLPRVGPLHADGDVGEREDAVEVDENGDHSRRSLRLTEDSLQEARLPVLPRCVQTDVVAPGGGLEQAPRLLVAVDDVVGTDAPRVDERVRMLHRWSTVHTYTDVRAEW